MTRLIVVDGGAGHSHSELGALPAGMLLWFRGGIALSAACPNHRGRYIHSDVRGGVLHRNEKVALVLAVFDLEVGRLLGAELRNRPKMNKKAQK